MMTWTVIGLAPSTNEALEREKQENGIDTCENDLGVGICHNTKDLLIRLWVSKDMGGRPLGVRLYSIVQTADDS